ncbi:MAG: SprT family zinc-dependent metalloprotease [Evtepia sp.]|uniref:M48 family metallopeptidase n=1 Tax=Evtepia sp. TaxID=2773933 RepID=UPI002A7525B2|nr:SprT family zinc-dependent metalloprotease [Evtepia sp.]MDY3014157.1 SprT family zinc-dependent metalloprotease [Evtepia sp.]
MKKSLRTVTDGEGRLSYWLEEKPVKNWNLRVRRDGTVVVSASPLSDPKKIDAFVVRKGALIRKAQREIQEEARKLPPPRTYTDGEPFWLLGRQLTLRVEESREEGVQVEGAFLCLRVQDPGDRDRKEALLGKYWKETCQQVFGEIMEECYPPFAAMGVARPRLRVRSMKTRWGSCVPGRGSITLNTQLLEAPRSCIVYVAIHEYCHLIHPNHSKDFYHLLGQRMPNWKEEKERLNTRSWMEHPRG